MREDRREYRRLDSVHLVSYVLKNSEGQEIKRGVSRSLDISTGGMRIEIDENVPVDTKIELSISIRDEINDFEGTVVYVSDLGEGKGFGAGIKVTL